MIRQLLKHLCYFLGYSLLGGLVVLVLVYKARLEQMPDLSVWHTAKLESEFHESDGARVRTLDDYTALETRLFAELKRKVYDQIAPEHRRRFSRYSLGSIADPLTQAVNWNRTFELAAANPIGGVLLLHGLSDSPYSMRALAERLNARGYYVIGLRLPGHGTAPSGLLDARWQDFAAAVRLAARSLVQRISAGKPFYMIGYSTGAALAVEYALARSEGEDLPQVARMVLISPAIGVSPAAALAVWQKRVGALLGVSKLAWTNIAPEYDPYKYNSFTVNAAEQVYTITRAISKHLDTLSGAGSLEQFPRILTFQSVADDTVSTAALVAASLRAMTPGKHELVLFDVNRHADVADLYAPGVSEVGQQLLSGPPLPFELTVIRNANSGTDVLSAFHRRATTNEVEERATGLSWPENVFSLSHVALPFPPDDPVYGNRRPPGGKHVYLGSTDILGERGLLAIAPSALIRLRYNPFFDYMAKRIEDFLAGE